MRYTALFTMNLVVPFDAKDDEAAQLKADLMSDSTSLLAQALRAGKGVDSAIVGSDYGFVALHRADEYDRPDELVCEV